MLFEQDQESETAPNVSLTQENFIQGLTQFLSKYVDKYGNPSERGADVLKAIGIQAFDLRELTYEGLLEEEKANQQGNPSRMTPEMLEKIVEVKLERHETRRVYKA